MHGLFKDKEIVTGQNPLINKINLITSFYKSKIFGNADYKRNNELEESLYHNINSSLIEKIHLFVDDDQVLESLNYIINETKTDKVIIIEVGKKPLYSDLFAYAQNNLQGKICMVSNSDIFIYEYNTDVINKLSNNKNICFSLTRHEYDLSKPLIDKYKGSHDCFIFNSPINNLDLQKINHVQHSWGAENIVISALKKFELKLFNPCLQIKIVHLHASALREQKRLAMKFDRVDGICKPDFL